MTVLEMQEGETRWVDMSFAEFPEMAEGDSIAGVTVSAHALTVSAHALTSVATVGPVVHSGVIAQFQVGGGMDGDSYSVQVEVVTARGNVLVGCGRLDVKGCL